MLFRLNRRTVSVPLPWCAHQARQVSDRSDPASSCTSALTAERRKGQIMKYNPSETGRRIKELRRENGITQEEFADRWCITDSYLRKIESGIRAASIETLVDVALSLQQAGVQFMRAGGYAVPAYTAVLNATVDGLDVISDQ